MRAPYRRSTGLLLTILSFATAVICGGSLRVSGQQPSDPREVAVPAELAEAPDTEKLTYWVVLRDRADLRALSGMSHDNRGRAVVERLRSTAARSQAGLLGFLRARGAEFTPYWAANVVKVTSRKATLLLIVRRPEVERIEIDRIYSVPEPIAGVQEATTQGVEWNIAKVRAPEVWATFGTRGEGIVVGNIDTGVQFNHPALVNQYRGNLGAGAFDHNYNWYDPASVCGNPSTAPCDNNNHGTHTMGTIAGDDGAGNGIGVAPGVRWIAAKGCESSSCSLEALVAAGQWMLAPTDLAGQNPRPELRPHVVSNSWGGAPGSTFYQQIVRSWVAAGIIPVFASGNSGPSCRTANSPGDDPDSYSVGAVDASNLIASFSSRGASASGGLKPNISAPGVNVRSSIAGGSYAAYSGTSMATPHIAGVVALVWAAAPGLLGDVPATRTLLDQTAIDTLDTSCGGTASNNNVYGQGRVDAFAAVDLAPRGPTGTLHGIVTDATTGNAAAGMEVRVVGPTNRTTLTNAAGQYSLTLPVGSYDVTVSGFGYVAQTAYAVWIVEAASTVQDFAISPAPSVALSGTVRNAAGEPVAQATVTIEGTPIPPVATDSSGAYRYDSVPTGTYTVRAEAGRCNDPQTQAVTLTGPQQIDFTLPHRSDSFGYRCSVVPQTWIDATTALSLTGDDASVQVALPFEFSFYGVPYSTITVTTNGYLTFGTGNSYYNGPIPTTAAPNAAVYLLWDDLYVDAASSMRAGTTGTSPLRQFVVEWRNVAFYGDLASRVDFQVALGEGGDILMQYRNISSGSLRERGNSATIGVENGSGTDAFQYALNEAAVFEGLSVRYAVPTYTGVEGLVTDANDGLPIATATVRALRNGVEVDRSITDASGWYHFPLVSGTYQIEASASRYETKSAAVTVTAGTATRQDVALRTSRAEVAPTSLSFTVAVGRTAQHTLTISSTGGLPVQWQLVESGGDVSWLSVSPGSGSVPPGNSAAVQVSVAAGSLGRGTYNATLLLLSDSGRRPSIAVAVNLTVSQYDVRINAGGPAYSGANGLYWSADAAYTVNGWGYTNGSSSVERTTKPITATSDPVLYQSQRVSPGEYRFDGLAPGTYQVTVGFAELRQVKPGVRVVNIVAEGTTVLPAHDVMSHAGALAADAHTFTIAVNDGQLNLLFVPQSGSRGAIVNAIRVLQQ